MIRSFRFTVLAGLMAFPMAAGAGSDGIVVDAPWSRASIGTSRPGVAYMALTNTGDSAATLTGLKAEISGMPELHRSGTNADGVSTMEPAGDITIPPGETVSLEPGGLHAMLMRLTAPLEEGQTFPLTLVFEDGAEIEVEVPILAPTARGPAE